MRPTVPTPVCLLPLVLACAEPAPPPAEAPAAELASPSSGGEDATRVAMASDDAASALAPSTPPPAPALAPPSAEPRVVFVNGAELAAPDLAELQAIFGAPPDSGRYWYDPTSGLYGLQGHGAGGVTKPALRTLAKLPPDASAGRTGAFVNGRELTAGELTAIATLLGWPLPADSRYSGRYTLDAEGALHSAQGRYLGNVAAAAKRFAGSAEPSAIRCIWFHLHEPDEAFGRGVTIACD